VGISSLGRRERYSFLRRLESIVLISLWKGHQSRYVFEFTVVRSDFKFRHDDHLLPNTSLIFRKGEKTDSLTSRVGEVMARFSSQVTAMHGHLGNGSGF
jgi:hypothetical protein